MSGRWPNLFVAGVEKGGTTSLWQHLDAHPEVFMSEVKEPSFFIPDRHEAAQTEASYLSLFEGREEAWLGEASVRYFYDELAPGRIREAAPDGRILIILRDPVDRAYSAYWGTVRSGYERRSFREAVEIELQGGPAFDAENPRKAYVGRSYYLEPVERFLGVFGARVHVMFLEELRQDPRGDMEGCTPFSASTRPSPTGSSSRSTTRSGSRETGSWSSRCRRCALAGWRARSCRTRCIGRSIAT